MDFFQEALARLKFLLRVSKDGEIAEALGLSKQAFSERKKRGAFPERELLALAALRPEIDPVYVLTGKTQQVRAIEAAAGVAGSSAAAAKQLRADQKEALLSDKQAIELVDSWARCNRDDRDTIVRLAKRLAERRVKGRNVK